MPDSHAIAVALLYQPGQVGGHLKLALGDLGAAVVYEAAPSSVDRDALEGSGASVVIVNLDADSDDYIDALYDVLDAGDYDVVFNDAQVSSNLQGWDQARWARNLAAKILRRPEIAEPPRPPGAEAVPTPVQKSASGVPAAEKPGPEPAVEMPLADASAPPPEAMTSTQKPTVQMPLPEEFRTQPSALPDLDVPEPDEIAKAAETLAGEVPPARVGQSAPLPELGNLAAELDALFADTGSPGSAEPAPAAAVDELDIALPADFDLALDDDFAAQAIESDASGIPVDIGATSAPASGTAGDSDTVHDEFPAIFDQLDFAATEVPAASSSEFKPAERPVAHTDGQSEPALPAEWSLDDDVAASSAGKADFGIEKISAEEFLAPETDAPPADAQAAAEPSAFTLELVPMEEAVAPSQHNPDYFHENRLDEIKASKSLKVGTGTGIGRVLVLGASIGGPEAVRDYLAALPAGFPALFVVAQHMGEEFLELMSAQLRKAIKLTVRNPTHGERVAHGEVLVVPTTHRLQVDAEGVVTLAHLQEKAPYAPSIDQVLRDVADAFGASAGAIIFSGMAHDAIEGSQYLHGKGGRIWAQDPDTCVISSMIDGARAAGVVEFVGSPQQLAEKTVAEYGKA